MDNKNNIIKLIFILSFMVIGVVGMLKLGMGDDADDKQNATTEHHIATTTESTEDSNEDVSSHLIVPETIEGDWLEGEITIPRTLDVGEDGTITITEPKAISSGHDTDDVSEKTEIKLKQMEDRGVEVINGYGNSDGSTTLIYDKANFEKNIQYIEKRFNEVILETNCKVSVNKEYNHLVIYIDETTDPIFEYGEDLVILKACMIYAQIYTGTPYNEWSIKMTTVYEETEEIMLEEIFENGKEGSLQITNDTWHQMFENLDKNSTEEPTPEQGEADR